jgi:hypothetical protein
MMEPHELRSGSMMESTGGLRGPAVFGQPAVTVTRTVQEEAR